MAKTIAKKAAVKVQPSLDYPQQGETVTSREYTLRVTAPGACKRVEVSLDQGDWQSCRQANGHWWYDWSDFDHGEHQAVARIETEQGRSVSSEPHDFFVRF